MGLRGERRGGWAWFAAALGAYGVAGWAVLGLPASTRAGGSPDVEGWLLLELTALAVWVPWWAAGLSSPEPQLGWAGLVRISSRAVAPAAFLVAHGIFLGVSRVPVGSAIVLQAVVAAHGLALLGVVLVASRAGLAPGAAQLLATLVSLAALSGPLWMNPFVEIRGASAWRSGLLEVTLGVNPFAAQATVLGTDWLRSRVLYEWSVIGRFYPFSYPEPGRYLVVHLAAASVLLGASQMRLRSRSPGSPPLSFFG